MQITQILTDSERYLKLNLIKCNADLVCICSYSMIHTYCFVIRHPLFYLKPS